jgi:predicted Abi (CAAX) family protease
MGESVLERFWDFIGRVFLLQPEVFQQVNNAPDGWILALILVLVSGLSLSIAEAIILFINRVKPIRFIFSLLIGAILSLCGTLFLVFSTWLLGFLPGATTLSLPELINIIGLSSAPLLFSFLGAIPYFGIPLLSLLSIWHLLAMVVGFGAIAGVPLGQAFTYIVFGWLVLQLLQRTLGQPIANLGRTLADRVAGVTLVRGEEARLQLIQANLLQPASPLISVPVSRPSPTRAVIEQTRPSVSQSIETSLSPLITPTKQQKTSFSAFSLFGLLGIFLLTVMMVILLAPLRDWVLGSYNTLPRTLRFGVDLVWIALVALTIAGFLAPLETLGWWAGWYNDEIDTTINTGTLTEPVTSSQTIRRYLIYLDGIGQSSFQYLPDVETFLSALSPELPHDMALIRGIMTYSVLNNPLDEDRPLAFLWQLADKFRFSNPASLLGMMVNLRNVLIVAVSADQRYGPIYHQGIAQILYNALMKAGYRVGSGVPVTLIGYSGGGQMSAATAGVLKKAVGASIDVISLAGVISGNCNIPEIEHLYHLVGEKDEVEKLGPILFPGRWSIFPFSYWNRAKRRGKITLISLGPVGHQVPGGLLDGMAYLPDGRSYLQQTIAYIRQILDGELLAPNQRPPRKPSNYRRYKAGEFTHPSYYPLDLPVDPALYQPIAPWMGRLILPKLTERSIVQGVWMEIHHAPPEYPDLVGQRVKLRWGDNPNLQSMIAAVKRDVHFSPDAEYTSEYGGLIHPDRLDHWQRVDPLESLAGSRPDDDMVVMLFEPVVVESWGSETILKIFQQPSQITGRYYALVRFLSPIAGTDAFEVIHFNSFSRHFDGLLEKVRLPDVIADQNSCFPSTSARIERSPLNATGWYIYGAKDANGVFVVQSLAPRSLVKLAPDRVIAGKKASYRYIHRESWQNIAQEKGKISSVLVGVDRPAVDSWQEGERALVIHTYGGIGGQKREPAASGPVFFGHFAYGIATVIRDPLSNELRFEIHYDQVYTHNTDGLIAGSLHWSRYMGDRQFGWVGVRPTCDILIKFEPFTGYFQFETFRASPLNLMRSQLEVMTARYRIGDGTGGTYVGAANNCSQDSNQALFASITMMQQRIADNQQFLDTWFSDRPDRAHEYQQLLQLKKALQKDLQPLDLPRPDWLKNEYNLGTTLEDRPLRNLLMGLGSGRTLLPRLASDTIARTFLRHGAEIWVLRTNQIGGDDPEISPIAPMTL